MCDIHVWLTCVTYMCDIHVWLTCVTYMCDLHVWLTCVTYMCDLHVWLTCVTYMCDLHVWHTCVTYMCNIQGLMRLTRLRADSRGTPTARGRQCRMSNERTRGEWDGGVKNKNKHNTQINLNKQKLGEPLVYLRPVEQTLYSAAVPKRYVWHSFVTYMCDIHVWHASG